VTPQGYATKTWPATRNMRRAGVMWCVQRIITNQKSYGTAGLWPLAIIIIIIIIAVVVITTAFCFT
jgi:hypothetical protein